MKQKTHSGAKKRFRVTRNGKVMSKKRNTNHLLEKKSASRKRRLSGTEALDTGPAKRMRKLLNK
ncbi:MAG: 50S ribosomal protein L35 [Nitriliruptorales bacterium]